jgi:hypothetical protein
MLEHLYQWIKKPAFGENENERIMSIKPPENKVYSKFYLFA